MLRVPGSHLLDDRPSLLEFAERGTMEPKRSVALIDMLCQELESFLSALHEKGDLLVEKRE